MKFLDTNAILKYIPEEKFAISSITLDELDIFLLKYIYNKDTVEKETTIKEINGPRGRQ